MDQGVNELNLLHSIAAEEASRLNCTWVGPEHFLLAILSPAFDDSPASKALAQCSITRESVEETVVAKRRVAGSRRQGLSWNPACHQMLGFATGLAACRGTSEVTAEHVLMAQVYEPGFAGESPTATRAAVLSALADAGVAVPQAPLPEGRTWEERSERVDVSLEELDALVTELPRLVPGGITWNQKGKRGWVQAVRAVDLNAIIPFALDAWNRRRLPCPCCGYVTLDLDEPLGERVCEVCFWIDDPVQGNNRNYRGGKNGVSLTEARKAFERDGFGRDAGRGKVRSPEPHEVPPTLTERSG